MNKSNSLRLFSVIISAFLLNQTMSGAASPAKINETDASDPKIEYMGRIFSENGTVSFDWSGVRANINFNGRYLAIKCSDTKANYFNVWIDREPDQKEDFIIKTEGKDTVIVIADNLKKSNHRVTIQKRTEGEQGTVSIHKILTDGEITKAEYRKNRFIEFIGDSYTCGFGSENSVKSDPFKPETENCNLTYAAIASRYFDADYNMICHSGQGIARNYDDFAPGYTMTDRYSQIFDEDKNHKWTPVRTPDLVVIYLGANDFSTEKQPSLALFRQKYIELLKKIKDNYGEDTPVLCLAAKLDAGIFQYVKESCISSGLKNISYATMQDQVHDGDSDLGACYHPNYKGHRKMASAIIPYISTVTGWEMPFEVYR